MIFGGKLQNFSKNKAETEIGLIFNSEKTLKNGGNIIISIEDNDRCLEILLIV